ncbi:FtsB family cell division protein [Flavobacterium sp.]|uniref:FtsB family cell division protein n=1 Tax=Flavobacterium sp. TaxID=239 RepID=UPI004047E81D
MVLIFFIVWMLFLDNYSYIEQRVLNKKIKELEDNRDYYKREKRNDSIKIKKLKNSNQIEKYAREKYYMKREKEDVYVIEFEKEIDKPKEEQTDF